MAHYEPPRTNMLYHIRTYTYVTGDSNLRERNVGAEDGLRDKEAYQGQSITKSRVTDAPRVEGESFVVLRSWTQSLPLSRGTWNGDGSP